MIIKPFQSYFEIAKIEFKTLFGIDVVCTIKRIGSGGTLQTFTATGSPLRITMLSGENTFTAIKGSEATLNLHNLVDFSAIQLLSEGNRDYILEVTYAGNKIWSGYMMPDQWTEPLNTTPYPSQFRFIDGISLLKEIDFVDPTGCYFTGYFTDSQILGYCLSEIGLNRNFVDQINIIDVNTDPADNFGAMFQKWKNVEAFRGMTCYNVIESILESYVSRVEFIDNKYFFKRLTATEELVKSIEYQMNAGGSPSIVGGYTLQNRVTITGAKDPKATRVTWKESTQELYRLPGVKTIEIMQDYGRKETIFPRALLDECDFSGNQIKGWLQNGVEKATIDGNTCAKFIPLLRTTGTPAYTPPAYIEGSSIDEYSLTNVTADNQDFFSIDVIAKNDDFRPVGSERIGRSPGRGRIRTKNDTEVTAIDRPFTPTFNTEVKGIVVDNNRTLSLFIDILDNLGGTPIDWLNDRLDIIFTDVNLLPVGISANTPYRIVVWAFTEGPRVLFYLSDVSNPLFFFTVNQADIGKTFNTRVVYTRMDISLISAGTGRVKVNNQGLWSEDGFLAVELPVNNLKSERFFSLLTTTVNSPLGEPDGPLTIRIDKPTGNIKKDENDKAFLIESIAVQIIDTPEKNTEKITVNERNGDRYELNVMFAETPIKNNFKNNKLKYYNNFFSRSLSNAPGLQFLDIPDNPSAPTTLYNYIKSAYVELLKKHRYALAGTLRSDETQILGKIFTETFTKKDYLSTAISWDVEMHDYEVELHEIAPAPDAPFTGDFNDDYNDDYK